MKKKRCDLFMSTVWHTCAVYYHARNLHDNLILDCLYTALKDISEAHSGAYFDRRWYKGPHILVSIAAEPGIWSEEIVPTLREHIGTYLAMNPSPGCPDPGQEARQHRKLATLEHIEGPLEPWFPDNSIHFGFQNDRSLYMGGDVVVELMNDLHAETNALVLEMLGRVRAGTSRQELCLKLLFALAHSQCPPISRGFLSYHSHAEAFLENSDSPLRTRKAFHERYNENRSRSGQILDIVVRNIDSDIRDESQGLMEWISTWDTYRSRAHSLFEQGQIYLTEADAASAQDVRSSDFLQGLERSGDWDRIRNSFWFGCYRLLLNATYAQIARLGVVPLERYLLCYIAARTVEDATGMDATESVLMWRSVDE